MAGIVGYCSFNNSFEKYKEILPVMIAEIKHRGGESWVYSDEKMCSLAVTSNLLDAETLKRSNDVSNNLFVVLDGEIRRIFDELSKELYQVPDTELILRLYKKYGIQFVDKIDGSYALSIWDGNKKQLVIVRDRLGVKPLFYTKIDNAILFASEIKSILRCKGYNKSINLIALNNFLTYGYIPNPNTLFDAVYHVRPGHLIIFTEENCHEKKYWRFNYKKEKEPRNDDDYVDAFRERLDNAVSRCVRKYPSAGAFLSGGLDTSSVAAKMYELKGQPFKVFTAGFKEERYNEIDDAKIIVDHFGLDHYTVVVDFDTKFPSTLEKIIWYHDSPFYDTSAVPSYYASRLAKQHVNEVITGDFPDQLIGGSGHQVLAMERERNDPSWKKMLRNKKLNQIVSALDWSSDTANFHGKLKRFIYRETYSLEEQRIILNMIVPPLLKKKLYSKDMISVNRNHDPMNIARSLYNEVKDENLLNKLLYFDIHSYAVDDLMVKVDRMTAAHGLTAVSPFHDIELVEFIASVPGHLKIRGNERKYIMRETLRSVLPKQTLDKKKQGFAMPIGAWMVNQLSDYVRDVLLDPKTLHRGYFNKAVMETMVENYLSGRSDYATGSEGTIISLITLELWHRIFIDN